MSRTYGLFDPAHKDASLVLGVGNTTVQTSSNVNGHRCAKGDQYQSQFISSVTFVHWSPDGSNPSLTPAGGVPPLIFGFVLSTAPTNKYVGEDGNGVGFCPGDGKFYISGSPVATFSAVPFGAPSKLVLDAVNGTVTLYVKGVLQGVVTITSGLSWTYAATVSGAAGALEIQQFTGGDPPMPYHALDEQGWWIPVTDIEPILLANESYMTAATDTPRHEKYAGDLDKARGLAISNSVGAVWPWGASAPGELHSGGSLVQVQINDPTSTPSNPSGKYEPLQTDAARGAVCSIAVNQNGGAATAAVPIFAAIVDHAERDTVQTVQLYLRGLLDQLQAAMRRAVFTRADDPSVAGRPRPSMIGPCRNYTPPLQDTLLYPCTDAPIGAFGQNRVAGKPIALTTDFTLHDDSEGIDLVAAPAGKLSVESTTTGGSFDPGATDYLSGLGTFVGATADGNGHPTGWTAASNAGLSQANMWQVVATGVKQDCGIAPNKRMSLGAISALPAPVLSGASHSGSGGTLAANTYYYKATWTNFVGETVASNEVSQTTTGTTSTVSFNIAAHPFGASGLKIYRSTSSGTEILLDTLTSTPTSYTDDGSHTPSGSGPPGADSTIPKLHAGRSYAYKVVVHQCPLFGNQTGNHYTVPATLELTWQTATAGTFYWAKHALDGANGGPKTLTGIMNNTAATDQPFYFRLNTNELSYSAGLNLCIIELVAFNELPSAADNVVLDGPNLTQMISEITVARGPYNPSQVSTVESDAIDAATGYIYGLGIKMDENPNCAESLKKVCDSCTGTPYYTDQLRVFRLSKPESVTGTDIAFDLDYRAGDFLTPLIQIPDMAENLSAHAYGCRNIDPYGDGDFLNTSYADCANNVRQKLKLPYQFKATTTKKLAQRYSRAWGRDPFPTCLDRQADLQDFIDHACDNYTDDRNFYEADVWMPPIRRRYNGSAWVDSNGVFVLGSAIRIFYPMEGWPTATAPFSKGGTIGVRTLWLIGFAPMTPDQNKCKAIFWGL